MTACPVCGRERDEPCDVVSLDDYRAARISTPAPAVPAGSTATVLPFLRREQRLHEDDAA